MASAGQVEKEVSLSAVLSVIAGVLMVVGGVSLLIMITWYQSFFGGAGFMMGGGWRMMSMPGALVPWMVGSASALSIGLGTLVIAAGYKLHKEPSKAHQWGFLILITSIIGLFGMSGFGLGSILGIVAGAIAITRKL